MPRPFVLSFAALLLAGAARAQDAPAAVTVGPGVTAEGTVVALGRDVLVEGRALQGVTALRGSVRISGSVIGDVVVLGGDASILGGGHVEGDVLVFGGSIRTEGEAGVSGRSAAYPEVARSWLVLAEGPALGLSPFSRPVIGAKTALLFGWSLLVVVLMLTAESGIVATAGSIASEPLRDFVVGVVAVMAMMLAAILVAGFLEGLVGVPILVLLVVAALVLKLWGVVACLCWLGSRLDRGRRWIPGSALRHALLGLLALGALKYVPWVGTWTWTAATLVGIGATLTTKFGRGEAWIEGAG